MSKSNLSHSIESVKSDLAGFRARVKEVLDYDPTTGVFVWRIRMSNRLAGQRAGYADNVRGYRYINIDGVRHYEHRLAWLIVKGEWPEEEIDHKNLDGGANWFDNLRKADSSQNKYNRAAHSDSSTGLKGVTLDKRRGTYSAEISCRGIRHRKSGFPSPEAAHAVYCEMARELHGEFARLE